MNKKVLHDLFDGYIDQFEFINRIPDNDETYKWEATAEFQSVFDLDAADFPAMLKLAQKSTKNLIDNKTQPFGGLVVMAEKHGESEYIRNMFKKLFDESNGDDFVSLQSRIDSFLDACDELLEKHYPGSFLYKNDQRTAMAYLWFYNPDKYYLCKTSEASYLANCVEFYDSWGTYANFNLKVYYRFCDELVSAIREYEPLMKTHMSRFETTRHLYPDINLHILVFDIIYCAETYGLYAKAKITHRTQAEVDLYLSQKKTAYEYLQALKKAEDDVNKYYAVLHEVKALLESGTRVSHNSFGVAKYIDNDETSFRFYFKTKKEEKRILFSAFAEGHVIIDSPLFNQLMKDNKSIIIQGLYSIRSNLNNAKIKLIPYMEYLD